MILNDIRHSFRMLGKHPAYAIAALVTLAFGITANTTIFTFANAFLFKPYPYPNDHELLAFGRTSNSNPSELVSLSYPDFDDIRTHNESFENVAAYTWTNFNVASADRPIWAGGARVTGAFFDTLELQPTLGRTFRTKDDIPGAPPVVVLAESLWREHFGADPGLIENTIRVDGVPRTVIGIVPTGTEFPLEARVWIPLAQERIEGERNRTWLSAIARLKTGFSPTQAKAELRTLGSRLNTTQPQSTTPASFHAMTLRQEQMGDNATLLFTLLLGAVALLLLIVCTNVANLQLSRAVGRANEFAVRAAIGATRGRMIRQLLTESFVLASLAALLGLLLSRFTIELVIALLPEDGVSWFSFAVDYRIIGYTAFIAILATLFFGLAPALRISQAAGLQSGTQRAGSSLGSQRLQSALVVSEIAFALGLVACGTVMVRGFTHLAEQDPGFASRNVLTGSLSLPENEFPNTRTKAQLGVRLEEGLQTLPGVESAGFVSSFPLSGSSLYRTYSVEGQTDSTYQQNPDAIYKAASPQYFTAMGIPVIDGRRFQATDNAGTPRVVIVNEPLAKSLWPGEPPLGKRLKFDLPSGDSEWAEVVGIVGGTKHEKINRPAPPQIYVPYAQAPTKRISLAVKTLTPPASLIRGVESKVQSVAPHLALFRVMDLDQWMQEVFWPVRLATRLFWTFGLLALLLSAIGIYGVMLFAVQQRQREIGIRMAMGALRKDIIEMILKRGLRLGGIGIGIGVLLALGMTQALGSAMLGTSGIDFLSLLLSASMLLGVSLLACLWPSVRAARSNPMQVLRQN